MAYSTSTSDLGKYGFVHTWSALDTGSTDVSHVAVWGYTDKSVQAVGTWGAGGTVVIEGSNQATGTVSTYVTLTDPSATALSFGANGLKQILQNVVYIRPRVSAGDATTNLTVRILVTSQARG